MKRRLPITLILIGLLASVVHSPVWAQQDRIKQQSEEEFRKLMPITGTVKTMGGDFKLDNSFPAPGEAEKIYDLMDHQRATQLWVLNDFELME